MNTTKHCPSCHTTKHIDDYHKNKRTKDGRQGYCKACSKLSQQSYSKAYYNKNRQKICATVVLWQKQNRHKVAARNKRARLQRHGINSSIFEEMLLSQNFKCAICFMDFKQLKKDPSIDHDHKCCPGEYSCGNCIRGLLCNNCNAAIGLFKDSSKYLRLAADYIDGHGFFEPLSN